MTVEAIFAARDEDAFVTSDCTAREPDVSPAPVSVRVAADQISEAIATPDVIVRVPAAHTAVATSDANVPKLVSVRLVYPQIKDGSDAARDVEAARTVAFVFEFIFAAIDVEAAFISATVFTSTAAAISVVEAPVYPIRKLLSKFAKSPPSTLPQVMVVG